VYTSSKRCDETFGAIDWSCNVKTGGYGAFVAIACDELQKMKLEANPESTPGPAGAAAVGHSATYCNLCRSTARHYIEPPR